MADKIDKLEIEIEASSTKAVQSIKALSDAFKELKGTVPTNTAAKRITELSNALKSIDNESTIKLNQFSKAFERLGALSKVRIPKDLGDNLRNVALSVQFISDDAIGRLDNMTRSLQRLANVDLRGVSSALKSAGKVTGGTEPQTSGQETSGGGSAEETARKLSTVKELINSLKIGFVGLGEIGANAFKKVASGVFPLSKMMGGTLLTGVKRAASGVLQLSKNIALIPFNAIKNRISGAINAINKFTSSIGRILMYRAIRALIKDISQAIKEGIDNLSAYSRLVGTDFHKSMDSIATDALYIKNSFASVVAPIINSVKPAIDAIADSIANALNLLAQFMAMLTGASTYTRAIKKTTEYGDAVQKAGAKAKEAAKSLLKIDELNLLNDNKSGGGVGANMEDFASMFEEAAVTIENPFEDIFDVFKKAWESEGLATINAIKAEWQSIKDLVDAVGKSFREVFTNGTGQETLELYLRIVQNIAGIVGGLADSFRRAWEENERGTAIVQNLWNIHNDILKMWERITAATKEWVKNLDFGPVLDSVNNLLDSLEPLVSIITGGLAWAWENVMLPIGKWTIEEAAPAALDLLSSALDVLVSVIEKLKPFGEWLWENFLKPLGTFTGDAIINALTSISNILQGLADFLNGDTSFREFLDNLSLGEELILAFASALSIESAVTAFTKLISAMSVVLTSAGFKMTLLVAGVVALAYAIDQAAGVWDKMTGLQKAVTVLGALVSVAFLAAAALGAFHTAATMGIAAIAITAGIAAVMAAVAAAKSQAESNLSRLNASEVKPYANGGFPESGQLFMARENGAELVGSIGNRTAVANNGQIVEGISEGVAYANSGVIGAINQLISVVQQIDPTVELDGLTVSRRLHKYDRQVSIEAGTPLAVEVRT